MRKQASKICAAAFLTALVLSSCSTGSPDSGSSNQKEQGAAEDRPFDVFVVNTDLSVGRNFLVLAVRGPDGSFRGAPEATATIDINPAKDADGMRPAVGVGFSTEARFVRGGETGPGVYGARVSFPAPGAWDISIRFANSPSWDLPVEPLSAVAVVSEKSQAPSPGEPAPRSGTKTLKSEGGDLTKLTSDPNPDFDLYAHSLDEAIGSGKPVVAMFATPLRCKSAMCGPAIEQLKKAKAMYPEAIYIHIDVYEKPTDVSDDTYVQAVREWRLPTEPMTFVITPEGYIFERFEGMFLAEQLVESIEESKNTG